MRKRVVVHGQVQGVFFRDSTRERARSTGVAGWVTNRPDGAVEAVLEGDQEAVESMVRWMSEGPRRADVYRIEVHDEAPEGLSDFTVR